jgi:hypothetical protein
LSFRAPRFVAVYASSGRTAISEGQIYDVEQVSIVVV